MAMKVLSIVTVGASASSLLLRSDARQLGRQACKDAKCAKFHVCNICKKKDIYYRYGDTTDDDSALQIAKGSCVEVTSSYPANGDPQYFSFYKKQEATEKDKFTSLVINRKGEASNFVSVKPDESSKVTLLETGQSGVGPDGHEVIKKTKEPSAIETPDDVWGMLVQNVAAMCGDDKDDDKDVVQGYDDKNPVGWISVDIKWW